MAPETLAAMAAAHVRTAADYLAAARNAAEAVAKARDGEGDDASDRATALKEARGNYETSFERLKERLKSEGEEGEGQKRESEAMDADDADDAAVEAKIKELRRRRDEGNALLAELIGGLRAMVEVHDASQPPGPYTSVR